MGKKPPQHKSGKSKKKKKKQKHNFFPKHKRLSRREVKKKAVEYMGGKCEACGYDACLAALTFHHLDPAEKDFNISALASRISWDKLLVELRKCVALCLNCHVAVHEGLLDGYFIDKDGYRY